MLWGGPPEPEAVRDGVAEPEALRERVAEEMVLLVPAEADGEAETLVAREVTLAATELAEERAEAALDRAEAALERALEKEPDPPVRPNWPEKLLVDPRRISRA